MGVLGTRINPECEKETPVYSEELIQKVLRGGGVLSFNSIKYRAENLNIYAWESDSLAVTKSGYAYEYEIKISRADFKNDFKHKKIKHQLLEGKYVLNGFETVGDGKMRLNDRPNYFFYVVPEDLVTVDEVPDYAGLIYIKPTYNYDGTIRWYKTVVVKEAPRLHKDKIDETHLKLAEKFYYNYITWKYKYQDEIEEYKKRIAEATSFDGKRYRCTLPEAIEQVDDLARKLYNSEEQNKMHKDDIKYYVGLTRRLKKLLDENNIEYEGMVRDYDALTCHKNNEE